VFIEPDDKDTSAIGHEGAQYESDSKGRFDVPVELGQWLAARPGWSISEDQEPVKAKAAPAKAPARKPAAKAADK
jgi:hypothetical protein